MDLMTPPMKDRNGAAGVTSGAKRQKYLTSGRDARFSEPLYVRRSYVRRAGVCLGWMDDAALHRGPRGCGDEPRLIV